MSRSCTSLALPASGQARQGAAPGRAELIEQEAQFGRVVVIQAWGVGQGRVARSSEEGLQGNNGWLGFVH
jgi:hypothetical protein